MQESIKIFIDPTLPHATFLRNKLLFDQVKEDQADVKLLYAHDRSMRLEPLAIYNANASRGIKDKVVFFSWYKFSAGEPYYYHLFSPYVGPGKMHLWGDTIKFVQLPSKIDVIFSNILNLTNYAK